MTTAENADEIVVNDVSAGVTKKMTRGDLLKAPLPNNSVTTAAVSDIAVTSPKIDLSTFGNLLTGTNTLPIRVRTGVLVGYSLTVTLTRIGNLVLAHGNTTSSTIPAIDSTTTAELIPVGYRPRTVSVMSGVCTVGAPVGLGWAINTNGTMQFSSRNAASGPSRIAITGMWVTEEAFPAN